MEFIAFNEAHMSGGIAEYQFAVDGGDHAGVMIGKVFGVAGFGDGQRQQRAVHNVA